MKKSKFLLLVLILCLCGSLFPLQAMALEDPEVSSGAAILLDAESGEVLFSHNAERSQPPASTTKIMTALLTIEAVEAGLFTLDDSVAAYDDCMQGLDEDSSTANPAIEPGEVLTVRDLLYCAMLSSANEACNILARYVSGSISDFVDLMNDRAEELGCTGTRFANPSGLDNRNHYSTARDLALITMEALRHQEFITLCSDDSYTVSGTNLHDARSLTNTNALLRSDSSYYYSDAFGVKTGYLSSAGYCLVSAASRNSITLISVVLDGSIDEETGEDSHYADTVTLFDWGFNNFSYQQVLSSTETLTEVPVLTGTDASVPARPEISISVLLPNDFDPDSLQYDCVVYSQQNGEDLIAPVNAGIVLGEVTVSAGDRVFGTASLVAARAVDMSKSIYLSAAVTDILRQPIVHTLLVLLIVVLALYLILVFFYAVQRFRHVQSLRQARQDLAERRAMHESRQDNIYVALPEGDSGNSGKAGTKELGADLGQKLRGALTGLKDRLPHGRDDALSGEDESVPFEKDLPANAPLAGEDAPSAEAPVPEQGAEQEREEAFS